jgi:hypothetical protein
MLPTARTMVKGPSGLLSGHSVSDANYAASFGYYHVTKPSSVIPTKVAIVCTYLFEFHFPPNLFANPKNALPSR